MAYLALLYRYWWNTRIFPFTKKLYLHRAQWRYYFYLSRVRILVSPWLLTWLANYKRASHSGARPVLLKFHSQNGFVVRRRYSYRWLSPNFHIDTFPSLKNIQEVSESDVKKFYLCRNFISIYKTNRTLRSQAVVPSKKEGGGKLRFNSLMGMCRWIGSLFHDWIDYKRVEF